MAVVDPNALQYPSVELAYEFIHPSNQAMMARLASAEDRAQTLMRTALTVAIAVPAIARATFTSPDFGRIEFMTAVAAFVVVLILGYATRIWSSLHLTHPGELYEHFLHLTEWEFKKDMLFHAGEAYEQNRLLVMRASTLYAWMVGCFLFESALFVAWIISP